MGLFGWRVRRCLLLVLAVLLSEQGLARAESQLEDSACIDPDLEESAQQLSSLSADEPEEGPSFHVGHGRSGRHRRDSQLRPQHAHDHDHEHELNQLHQHDHQHQHEHRQAHHGARPDHWQHQVEPEPLPAPQPQPQPHALGRSDGESSEGDAHDLLDCQPQAGDRLLARSVVKAEFRPLGWTEAKWFYPQNGRDQRTIHCVRVLDQRRDGHGGYPKIVRGGVGHHYVDLSFKSDFSRGIHFVVEVYGQ